MMRDKCKWCGAPAQERLFTVSYSLNSTETEPTLSSAACLHLCESCQEAAIQQVKAIMLRRLGATTVLP